MDDPTRLNQLTRWLAQLAEEDRATASRLSPAPSAACPSRARWRRSLLQETWRSEDRAHLRDCPRCQQAVERLRQHLWHPTTGELFWHERRSAANESDISWHLDKEGCQRCRRRRALLQADQRLIHLAEQVRGGNQEAGRKLMEAVESWGVLRIPAFTLRNPRAAAAQSGTPLDLSAGATGAAAMMPPPLSPAPGTAAKSPPPESMYPEARLVEDEGEVALEVKTQNAAWNRQLLRYVFEDYGGKPALSGFVLLRPDANGWFVAARTFAPQKLYDAVGGKCQGLRVGLVDLDDLTAKDHALVLESAQSDLGDAQARAAWRSWAADLQRQGDQVSDDLRQLAKKVESL